MSAIATFENPTELQRDDTCRQNWENMSGGISAGKTDNRGNYATRWSEGRPSHIAITNQEHIERIVGREIDPYLRSIPGSKEAAALLSEIFTRRLPPPEAWEPNDA